MDQIVKMQKMTLVALKKDRRKIMNVLTKIGASEITLSNEYENTVLSTDVSFEEEVDRKLGRLTFAFSFLDECNRAIKKERKTLPQGSVPEYALDIKKENRLVDYSELSEITKDEYELFNTISSLEKANSTMTDIKAEKVRINNLLTQLSDYVGLDIKFSQIKDTKNTSLFVGLIPTNNLQMLETALPDGAILRTYPNSKFVLVSVVCHNDDKTEIVRALSNADFTKCPFDDDKTAAEIIEEQSIRLKELEEQRIQTLIGIVACMGKAKDLKLLYDYYLLEKDKLNAEKLNRETGKTFILDCWTPTSVSEYTSAEIKKVCPSAVVFARSPIKGEIVPTLTNDCKVVQPFASSITSTFGYPIYGEMNPNPFVAFFFFLFFGFMLSDAGYGLVMTIACFAYLLIKKPVKRSGDFIAMLGICGISTVFWGAIFGGWFSISAETLSTNALGRFLLSLKCIDPLDGQQTLIMFGLALGLGVLQLGVGFFLSGYNKIKTKDIAGILSDWAWVAIFIGAGIFLLDILLKVAVIKYIGLVIIGLGVLSLIVGGAYGKKNPVKMLIGSFKNLYGTVSVFSDILSYARLFGLGLCTGVIGMVFNKLGLLFVDMIGPVGYVFAVIVWIVGHTFNIAINTLGVYVHNSRLQYVEFFGKFFEGGGHAFAPLGSKTKYVYLKDKLTSDEMEKTARFVKNSPFKINN